MVSLTGEYALRAMVYLAQRSDEWPIPGRTIAADTGIPRKYLSSILSVLVRSKVLNASRGLGGGFSMARPAREIKLLEVLASFEQALSNKRSCPFDNGECDEDDPCPAHDRWRQVRVAYSRFLERTSVHPVAFKGRQWGGSSVKRRTKR